MRWAYAALGIGFTVLIGGYLLFVPSTAEAPVQTSMGKMTLQSSAFREGERIPSQFTCDGDNINPELIFGNVPENTVSLVLIMDDPDVRQSVKDERGIDAIDHWILFNIPPNTSSIAENTTVGVPGENVGEGGAYVGPCPPPQFEPAEHRYFFRLYALDTELGLHAGATKEEVRRAMEGHVIDNAELIGRYSRDNN